MKLSKRQLKRIIRRTINESEEIYPRPQHPMIANAGAETHSARVDSIADELMMSDYDMSAEQAQKVAEMILNRLKQEGLI